MMHNLRFTYYPHPTLREKSAPIQLKDGVPPEEILDLLRRMKRVCLEYDGIGLAAQQVGIVLPVAVVGRKIRRGEKGDIGDYKLIGVVNPKILAQSDEILWREEGCLSFPGLYFEVPRPAWIVVRAWFDDVKKIEDRRLEMMDARVAYHEIDHLSGILFIDRIDDVARAKIRKELKRIAREHPEQMPIEF